MEHPPSIYDPLSHSVPVGIQSLIAASILVLILAWIVRRDVDRNEGVIPDGRFSLRTALEVLLEGIASLAKDTMGPHWPRYMPVVGTLGFFILVSNLMGLLPGMGGPTSFVETNLGWALVAFLVSEAVGVKEHGAHYIYHFTPGPSWMSWFTFPIEVFSHLVRIVSLTLRLTANMFADHTLLGIILGLPVVGFFIPWAVMGLGVFVSFVQAFIFTFLTMIYIGQAVHEAH